MGSTSFLSGVHYNHYIKSTGAKTGKFHQCAAHKNQSSFEWPANQKANNLNLISQTDKTKIHVSGTEIIHILKMALNFKVQTTMDSSLCFPTSVPSLDTFLV